MGHRIREVRQRIKRVVRRVAICAARWLVPPWAARRLANLAALSRLSSWFAASAMDCSGSRYTLYDRILKNERLDGPIDYLEFGVYRGASLRWWCEHLACDEARFYGFDSFEGLPEEWGAVQKGTFNTAHEIPHIDDRRVDFVVGWFQDTLPDFLRGHPLHRRKIIHMDADLYSSTLYVLALLSPYLTPGDIIIFDEFGSIRMAQHEFRAFEDFQSTFRIDLVPLGTDSFREAVAVRVASCAGRSPVR